MDLANRDAYTQKFKSSALKFSLRVLWWNEFLALNNKTVTCRHYTRKNRQHCFPMAAGNTHSCNLWCAVLPHSMNTICRAGRYAKSSLCDNKTACITANSELQIKSIRQVLKPAPAGLFQEQRNAYNVGNVSTHFNWLVMRACTHALHWDRPGIKCYSRVKPRSGLSLMPMLFAGPADGTVTTACHIKYWVQW